MIHIEAVALRTQGVILEYLIGGVCHEWVGPPTPGPQAAAQMVVHIALNIRALINFFLHCFSDSVTVMSASIHTGSFQKFAQLRDGLAWTSHWARMQDFGTKQAFWGVL